MTHRWPAGPCFLKSQAGHVLKMFLNFQEISAWCSYKLGSYKKKKCITTIGVRGIWGFWNVGTSPLNSKSNSNLSQTERSSIRGLQIASKGLRGLQRASWGLREPIFFLFFFISSFFFTFLPLVLSPTPFCVQRQGISPEVPEVPSRTPMITT